jgi:ABC-type Fe3+ transport system substrate-binding protein
MVRLPFLAKIQRMAALLIGLPLTWINAHAADPALVQAAQREGRLVWYTTLLGEASQPIVAAFRQRYPGIEVQTIRASAPANAAKVIQEARAGEPIADLFDGSSTAGLLMSHGLVQPYIADSSKSIPAEFKDPQGYWTATVLYYMTLGYNPELITPAEAPSRWRDLLDPKWQGKMAWSTELAPTAAQGLIANVLLTMGQDEGMRYLRQLSQQGIANLNANPRKIVDAVGRKEYPIGLQVMVHHTTMARHEGLQVNWQAMEPLTATGNAIGIVRNATHTNAAKLMVEFILSEQGQVLLKAANHIPANSLVESGFPELSDLKLTFITPVLAAQNDAQWSVVLRELFIKTKN